MEREKIILHIDMDSYFASAEQQANPFLRGKPVVVSGSPRFAGEAGKEGSRSVIVASSREAKKFGVKTGLLHHEAKILCPQLIFVEPDGDKYESLHRQFVKVFKKYTDRVEVFSIDEAFLDLTGLARNFLEAKILGLKIKKDLKSVLGAWVTCSIGIAKNKLLAKLASDRQKPDGLVVIDENNLEQVLISIKLTDFCGIGNRIMRRLENLGIDCLLKLRNYPVSNLIAEFGPFVGKKLHQMSLGIDDSIVVADFELPDAKSVGRSYTLPRNTFDKDEIQVVLGYLCDSLARELRSKRLSGRAVVIYFRYGDFTHVGTRKTLTGFSDNEVQFFDLGKRFLEKIVLRKGVRLVGVHVSELIKDYRQMSLWHADQKRQRLTPFLDKINNRYGALTVKPAFLLKLKRLKNKVGGFKP